MSRWEEVLHQQNLLWRWWISDAGRRYQESFVEDATRKGQHSKAQAFSSIQANQTALMFNADPIFVDGDVQSVLDVAAEHFEPEPFLPQDLITPVGFMVFPRAIYLHDNHGKRCAIRAFAWQPALSGQMMDNDGFSRVSRERWDRLDYNDVTGEWYGAGIELAMYSHDDDEDEYNTPDQPWMTNERGFAGSLVPGMKFSLFHVDTILFGRSFADSVEELHRAGALELWRYFQATQRIARQRITAHSEQRLPRQMRRQLAREGEPRTDVTVITLRRAKTKTEQEERSVEWSCRWLVRGFWRNQFYPSEDTHRQIWISGYCKGPPDKELRVTKRAFEFVR